jgi:V/A-type H+/Na+-transporting ATPase subunit I
MIVPMARIQVAAAAEDRDRLLESLARLGAVHILPVDPAAATPDDDVAARLDAVRRAVEVLGGVEPAGPQPRLDAGEAARRVLAIRDRLDRREERLARMRRWLERTAVWGHVEPRHLAELEDAGVAVHIFAVPAARVDDVRGALVRVLGKAGKGSRLVVVAGSRSGFHVPAGSRRIAPVRRSRAAVSARVARLERACATDRGRLARLAWLGPELHALRERLEDAARWSVARHSVLRAGSLCALEGWIPAARVPGLESGLEQDGLAAAVRVSDPGPDDEPPTLIRYARWARPIRGLFDMMGAVPGYHEVDLSAFFMFALPLFAGMIIGDAGYGLIFLLLPLFFRRWLDQQVGRSWVMLLGIFGAVALVWGAVTGVWFGITPAELSAAGGALGAMGDALYRAQWVRGSEEQMRATVIKVCFLVGTGHLVLAHLRRAVALAPAARAVAELGWSLVLVGMLGLVWMLFFGTDPGLPPALKPATVMAIIAGLAMVSGFAAPRRNLLRRLGLGLASSVLPLVNAFSDTLSYIRLMAVGLATHYIAAAFNTLAAALAGSTTWLAVLPVLALGHALNLALVLLAIFAHGVRLNMLEFSSNAGVQWMGHPFRPFALHRPTEV